MAQKHMAEEDQLTKKAQWKMNHKKHMQINHTTLKINKNTRKDHF
jgi:hypothetical protein